MINRVLNKKIYLNLPTNIFFFKIKYNWKCSQWYIFVEAQHFLEISLFPLTLKSKRMCQNILMHKFFKLYVFLRLWRTLEVPDLSFITWKVYIGHTYVSMCLYFKLENLNLNMRVSRHPCASFIHQGCWEHWRFLIRVSLPENNMFWSNM